MGGGWCPRDDRIVSSGASCPDCGATLIPLEQLAAHSRRSPKQPPAETEPSVSFVEDPPATAEPSIEPEASPRARAWRPAAFLDRLPAPGRLHRVTAVAIAVTLALAIGVAVPRNDRGRAPAREAAEAGRDVRSFVRVRELASLAGVTLRLDRVRQTGPVVEAFFSVIEGIDPTTLREIFVDVQLESGESIAVENASDRSFGGGFAVTFLLTSGRARVRQIRLLGLRTVSDDEPAPFGVEIDSVWPVSAAAEPRFVRVDQSRTVAGAPVRLVSLLLWRDRIEAILDLAELNRTAKRTFSFTRLFQESGGGGGIPANLAGVREAGDRLHLDFDGVGENARRVVLFLGQPTTIIDGPWSWVLPA